MVKHEVVSLSKKEIQFIKEATNSETGIYDFENNSSAEFKKAYGISKKDVHPMLVVLQQKMREALSKFEMPKVN